MYLATHPVASPPCGRHLIGLPCMGYFREAHQWASSRRVSAFPTFQLVQTLEKRSLDIADAHSRVRGDADASLLSLSCLINKKTRYAAGQKILAPRVGLEPTTTRLTAAGSTIELSRNCQVAVRSVLPSNEVYYTEASRRCNPQFKKFVASPIYGLIDFPGFGFVGWPGLRSVGCRCAELSGCRCDD